MKCRINFTVWTKTWQMNNYVFILVDKIQAFFNVLTKFYYKYIRVHNINVYNNYTWMHIMLKRLRKKDLEK